ncbi:hypothetical protein CNR22_18930 [Sphingobacteriaceae bacterium]|nr:hypothetical protein CNR22_18930 [Sphingobacteriaceae bacterium]
MTRTNTILLLEKDTVIARDIESTLRNFGYGVSDHKTKSSDVFSWILKEKPDLLIMEVESGEEQKYLETARLVYQNYQIPVVFLTTVEGKEVMRKLKSSTLHDFVLKPVVEKELVDTVELTLFRHAMKCKLQESEKKYNELSNAILQTVIECDLGGKILKLNRHGMEMFGITEIEIERGLMLTDYISGNESGSVLEVSKQSCFIDSVNVKREFLLVNTFKKEYSIEAALTPLYVDYKHSGYRGILVDVTHKKIKKELFELLDKLSFLYDRSDADITEVTTYVASEISKIIPDLDAVWFEDFNGQTSPSEFLNTQKSAPSFAGYAEFVAGSKKPLLLRGKEFEVFNRKEKFQNPLNLSACWMAFPIEVKNASLGVFVLNSERNRSALSLEDFDNLNWFFKSVNLFLDKLNCMKELSRSENLFKTAVNASNEGFIKIDLDSKVVFANTKLGELSGYTNEDVLGRNCRFFLQRKDFKQLADTIATRKKGLSSRYELRIKTKSGELKNFYVSGTPYHDENGKVIGSIATLTDLSVKKEQLALYAATETLLREITSKSDVAFWVFSFETKSIQYLSPAFKLLYEITLEEMYKVEGLRKYIHPDDVDKVLGRTLKNLSSDEHVVKYRIITPDGRLKWICDKSIVVKNSEGRATKLIGYAQEITKIKLLEEEWLGGELEKAKIIRSIADSFMIVDQEGKIIQSYFRKSEKLFLPHKSAHIAGKKIEEVVDERVAGRILENAGKINGTLTTAVVEVDVYRNELFNWYEIRMTSFKDGRILMIVRDITSNKNSIDKVHKLFNLAEQTHELIVITDRSGKVEYVNPMFTNVTGYEFHEVIGNTPDLLRSGRHSKSFYKNLWNTLKSGQPFKADFYNKNKFGEVFIEEKIITPYLDIKGEITNFISTGRDVTHERQEALKTVRNNHLEQTLAIKRQKSRTLSLAQGHENERRKFAKEIHEGLNQMLSVAMMNLENIGDNELITVEQKNKIEFVNKIIGEIMKDLRGLSSNLSPVSLFEFGLYAVFAQLVKKLHTEFKTLDITFKSNIENLRFPEAVELNFYRIIQEALQNALKHSGASTINMALNYRDGKLMFLIKDNGIGINKRELAAKKKKLFGLSTLEQRAVLIGAELEITTTKNKGFEINIAVKTKTIKL